MLSDLQIERYSRQILIPRIGGVGQERLLGARIALIGSDEVLGAAGMYLACAGVGDLCVEEHWLDDLRGMNPDCRVQRLPACCRGSAMLELADVYDVIICGAVGLAELTALLDACRELQTPLLWGSSRGAWAALSPRADACSSPCLECRIEPEVAPAVTGGFWVGTQLAMAAMAAILDLSPGIAGSYDEMTTGEEGRTSLPCRHAPPSRNADRPRRAAWES